MSEGVLESVSEGVLVDVSEGVFKGRDSGCVEVCQRGVSKSEGGGVLWYLWNTGPS